MPGGPVFCEISPMIILNISKKSYEQRSNFHKLSEMKKISARFHFLHVFNHSHAERSIDGEMLCCIHAKQKNY